MAQLSRLVALEVFQAISYGDLKRLQKKFPNYDYENAKNPFVENSQPPMPPLMWAAFQGKADIVQWLLSKGIGAAKDNQWLNRVLHVGITGGDPMVIRHLLDAGADPNWEDDLKLTAVQYALITPSIIAVLRNYVTEEYIAGLSIPDGAGGKTKLPSELVKPLRHLIMLTNTYAVRVALDIPQIFYEGNNPEIINSALKTMRDLKMQNNPEDYDLAMSYKFHYLACILNEILAQELMPEARSKAEPFITKMSFDLPLNTFITKTFTTFPYYETNLFKEVESCYKSRFEDKKYQFYLDTRRAQLMLEFAFGNYMDNPEGAPECALCKGIGASYKCNHCKIVYCDRKCQWFHWIDHKEDCDYSAYYPHAIDEIDPITLEELQDIGDPQDPDQAMAIVEENTNKNKKPTKETTTNDIIADIIQISLSKWMEIVFFLCIFMAIVGIKLHTLI